MPSNASQTLCVAVFCGSRFGSRPGYLDAARETGAGLARAGIRLIYGGGRVGLMGALADAAIDAGGAVSGIIPHFLSTREVMHDRVPDLTVTDSMHTRKQGMFAQADAFLVLPGGLGTFDETIEIITWRQLRLHDKPILIADIAGWATPLIAAIEASIEDGFADPSARRLFEVVPDVAAALTRLAGLMPRDASAGGSDASRL
ncbi:TIGR00730 family Rossman fold protein [Lichenicoccus sp.]|uniref:LOG family protein n=1 Tax=Lichenicoccus sp. TaxID=2781899 RepID=UPI003D1200BB